MTDLVEMVDAMPAEQRKGAIAVLDAITRPLSPREIEAALRNRGVTRNRAHVLGNTLRGLQIIAIVGPEE